MLPVILLLITATFCNFVPAQFHDLHHEHELTFTEYYTHHTILTYSAEVTEYHPDKVRMLLIGHSYQGREITALKISSTPKENNKPIILVNAGMHSREWISPTLALYLIQKLTRDDAADLISNVDWVIIPLLNPDGYEYSIVNDTKWRKTRSKYGTIDCSGVDINRNFDIEWTKSSFCTDDYTGPYSFSEPEAKALRDVAVSFKNRIKLFIDIHSYGPQILYPWSYTKDPLPPGMQQEHDILGKLVAKAIQTRSGAKYSVGQISKILYTASGSACDWMLRKARVPLSFALEVSNAKNNFQPATEAILSIMEEMFEGFLVFHKYIDDKWGLHKGGYVDI